MDPQDTPPAGALQPAQLRLSYPELPPLSDFARLLEPVWARGILSNGGQCQHSLEAALCELLEVEHISLFANATAGLMAALRTLGRQGEIITTPLSFVATANAVLWAGCTPVFADVDPTTLNLDPQRVEEQIRSNTVGVLPVHCFGRPCDTAAFDQLSRRHGLPAIYDAAHAFGVRQDGRSILDRGDLTVLSFHATKVFHTGEGGAVVCRDARAKIALDRMRNQGLDARGDVQHPGLNAKMSELHAAMGLLQLPRLAHVLEVRRALDARWRERLEGIAGIRCLPHGRGVEPNGAYFPVMVEPSYPLERDALAEWLHSQGVQTRAYFSPLIPALQAFRHLPSAGLDALPHARQASSELLCLPIHTHMTLGDVDRVAELIARPALRKP